jgi:hypothetical protein
MPQQPSSWKTEAEANPKGDILQAFHFASPLMTEEMKRQIEEAEKKLMEIFNVPSSFFNRDASPLIIFPQHPHQPR